MYDEIVDFFGMHHKNGFFKKLLLLLLLLFFFYFFFWGGGGGGSFLNILGLFLKVNVHNWTIFWGLLNLKKIGGIPDIRDIVWGKQ